MTRQPTTALTRHADEKRSLHIGRDSAVFVQVVGRLSRLRP